MSYALVLGALAALLLMVGAIAGLFWWVRRPVQHVRHAEQVPLPLFSHSRAAIWVRDEGEQVEDTTSELISTRAGQQGRAGAASVPSWSVPLPDVTAATARRHASAVPTADASAPAGSSAARRAAPPTAAPSAAPTANPSVQFSVPTDATLQFLPGRLEILSGSEQGREIRFVRLPGMAETRITFGRTAGEAYRHVQLHDATVSRDHAVMHLRGGEWHLVNHSATNPVLHNGVELAQQEDVTLCDGDRVEMGEVTFRFRR